MNKGLEVIEAHYLFGAAYDAIDIVIHPQSIIHSMVETADSSVLAQLGWPDMRLPILYTMSWPARVPCSEQTWPRLDFIKMGDLTFRCGGGLLVGGGRLLGHGCGWGSRGGMGQCSGMEPPTAWAQPPPPALPPACRAPDHAKYPSMKLAYASGRAGGTMTGVMSAANEQVGVAGLALRTRWRGHCCCSGAGWCCSTWWCCLTCQHPPEPPRLRCSCQAVELFLADRIGYLDIMRVVEACCEAHAADLVAVPSLEEIVHYDAWARRHVAESVNKSQGLAVAA